MRSILCLTGLLLVCNPILGAPRVNKPKPAQAAEFEPATRPTDGANLALAIRKLQKGFSPPKPFLIWALGSSYTAKLGNGDELIGLLKKRFSNDREIVYRRMVGNSCPWQYLRGWARHLVVPDQPDLVLIYTNGRTPDLEKLIIEIQSQTTADIIVPSIHWRERGKPTYGKNENAPDQNVTEARELCQRYGVEFVENRKDWGDYLHANKLKIEDLLNDAVHQSDYGATIVNRNIAAHFKPRKNYAYDPGQREQRIPITMPDKGSLNFTFTGHRIDLIGARKPGAGKVKVLINGQPADQVNAFHMTYIQYAKSNFQERRSPARDQSPHGVRLGGNIVPQKWTLRLLDNKGNFELNGSVTGPDGSGNAYKPFTSNSGQTQIKPDEWRRPERNRKGDQWSWNVVRSSVSEIDFAANHAEPFRQTVVAHLPNRQHTIELIATGDVSIEAFDIFAPTIHQAQ